MRTAIMTAALVAAAVLAGCANVRNGIYSIPADATDILRADLSFSFGTDLSGYVMLTKWAQVKSNSYDSLHRMGFGMRHLGWWEEDREDTWIGAAPRGETQFRWAPISLYAPRLLKKWRANEEIPPVYMQESADEIGVGVHVFVIGLRLGIRPFEIVDLLANVIGLDPSDDNLTWEQRKKEWEAASGTPQTGPEEKSLGDKGKREQEAPVGSPAKGR